MGLQGLPLQPRMSGTASEGGVSNVRPWDPKLPGASPPGSHLSGTHGLRALRCTQLSHIALPTPREGPEQVFLCPFCR